jgi:hypothetical protein
VLPGKLFAVSQLLLLVAALLVSTAAAALLALPELHYYYRSFSALTTLTVGFAAGAAVWAVVLLALTFGIGRRFRIAWLLTLANGVGLAATASAALVLRPGADVDWFATLSRTTAALIVVAAAAILVLAVSPPARAWFATPDVVKPVSGTPHGGKPETARPKRIRLKALVPNRLRSKGTDAAHPDEVTVVVRTMAPQAGQLSTPFPPHAPTPDPFDFNPFG